MSELAQRIVTSHKEAGKRAAEHLARTRKLKLSSAESLELVARVLGVANWQTLLSLANSGRGPRIDEGAAAPAPAPVVAPVVELDAAKRLAAYYGTDNSWGEHPTYPRSDWKYQVENGDTGRNYWEHVVSEIESNQEMFPWERDESFAVKIVQRSGATVDRDGPNWMLCTQHDFFFVDEHEDEASMWAEAADELQRHLAVHYDLTDAASLKDEQWLKIAEEYFTKLGQAAG